MEEDILATIIGTEKEIEEKVKAEKEKTALWLENEKRAIEMEVAAEVRTFGDSLRSNVEAARERAEKRAAAIVDEAAERRRLLSGIGDETLKRIIAEHIGRILPGSAHDIQDVKS